MPAGPIAPIKSPLFRKLWDKLDAARAAAKLKPEKVANRAGYARSTWFNYQRGETPVTLQALESIATVLAVKLDADVLSDPGGSVLSTVHTGGVDLTDDAQQVVAFMRALSPKHQKWVLDYVKSVAATQGFSELSEEAGPTRGQRNNK